MFKDPYYIVEKDDNFKVCYKLECLKNFSDWETAEMVATSLNKVHKIINSKVELYEQQLQEEIATAI